jgi:hypothetical protein
MDKPIYSKFDISLQNGFNFSDNAKIENGEYVSYYGNTKNELKGENFIDAGYYINVDYFIIEGSESNEKLFNPFEEEKYWPNMGPDFSNDNILEDNKQQYIERISIENGYERVVIINRLS